MYQLTTNPNIVALLKDGQPHMWIPADPNNTDWRDYQAWLAVLDEFGDPVNEPLAAD